MDGDNTVNKSKLEVITRSRHKARENVHAWTTIGFGFTSDWLKKWRENFEPINEWSNAKPKQFANFFWHSLETCSNKQHFLKSTDLSWNVHKKVHDYFNKCQHHSRLGIINSKLTSQSVPLTLFLNYKTNK